MDAFPEHPHQQSVRVLTNINRLDDHFGDSLVRVVCPCGAVHAASARSPDRLEHSQDLSQLFLREVLANT
jgi:hypothetical protein